MSEEANESVPASKTTMAEVRNKRRFSIIWVVPLLALLISGWLGFKHFSEKGPLITVTFETAEGLEAGKTKVKFKNVVVGEVEDIRISKVVDGVDVFIRMIKDASPYLTDKTSFWVVRATITGGEVSALGTLLSGAYIGVDPVKEGKPTKQFTGLEKPPLVTTRLPGQQFTLRSPVLGSLNIGSPVFYRQIKVGKVVDYSLAESGETVDIKIFIDDPHHKRINTETRFWNASGIDLRMDASGIKVDTQSLVSILQGGIAFETPENLNIQKDVPETFSFQLFRTRQAALEKRYTIKDYYLVYFDQSVRGLEPGAPVEFRGIHLGEVIDVKLILDTDSLEARIPVLIMLEPERMQIWSQGQVYEYDRTVDHNQSNPIAETLVAQGLRAQLKTGNLLTGQLYIDMDFFPDAKPVEITVEDGYPILPTVPSALGQLAENVSNVLKKIEKIPFEELGKNLNETILTLKTTLQEFQKIAGTFDQKVVPDLGRSLVKLQETMDDLRTSLGSDSALSVKTHQTLDELSGAIRSLKSVTDELNRNPRALLFGRGGDKQ